MALKAMITDDLIDRVSRFFTDSRLTTDPPS